MASAQYTNSNIVAIRLPLFLAGAYIATFIDGLTLTVSAALPSIARSFAAPREEAFWSNVSFSTAYYATIMLTPWLITRLGAKHHYILSIAGVGLASLLCALSPSFGVFSLCRFVEGVALGGVFVNTWYSIVTGTPPRVTRYALGIYGIFSLAGPAVGRSLGVCQWMPGHGASFISAPPFWRCSRLWHSTSHSRNRIRRLR